MSKRTLTRGYRFAARSRSTANVAFALKWPGTRVASGPAADISCCERATLTAGTTYRPQQARVWTGLSIESGSGTPIGHGGAHHHR
ncbi:MAG: hypothetical protein DMF88_00245 [Acidobacteria bacterium]|nr:MAG: hypothetical protein DMF88_00245 [Acidobacteriota bacterium]